MFNILFHYPRVLARHCQGPSAQARERYLTHCADQGAARVTLLLTARELLVIAQRLDLTHLLGPRAPCRHSALSHYDGATAAGGQPTL